jgi:hypothetical protein
MASYSALEDGSYLIDDGTRRFRTAMDPRAFEGMSEAPPAAVPSTEERFNNLVTRLDATRRENDPEYRAFAEARDLERQRTQLAERVESDKAEERSRWTSQADPRRPGTWLPDGTLKIDDGEVSDAGMSAPEPEAENVSREPVQTEAPPARQLGRSVPQAQPQQAPAQQGRQADPVRQQISNLVAQNIIKRTPASSGGWTPTTTTTTREGLPSAEALANVEQAARNVDALGDEAIEQKAEALRTGVVQPQLQLLESDMRSLEADYQRRKAVDEAQARMLKEAQAAERKAAEMPRINARADYWADKGEFARAMLAASTGLYAFGQALTGMGGPNAVTQQIEASIESNAERLRSEYEQAVQNGQTLRNAYSENLQRFGTPEDASKALRLEGQAIADRMRELQLARYGSLEQQQEWQITKAQRAEERAKLYADISAKAAGSTVSSSRYAAPSAGGSRLDPEMIRLYDTLTKGGDPEGIDLRRQIHAGETEVRLPAETARRLGRDSAYAGDKEGAREARDAIKATDKAVNAIDEMERILNISGRPILPEDRDAFKAAQGELAAFLASPLGLRQQTKEELSAISGPLTGASAVDLATFGTVGGGRASLNRARQLFQRDQSLWLRDLRTEPHGGGEFIIPNVNDAR